jgi:hypothetical protein
MMPRPGLNSRLAAGAGSRDCLAIDLESAGLGVPAPPREGFFESYFRRDCRPGEVLLVLPALHRDSSAAATLVHACPAAR